jgi:PhzF family phenazine biosynthesis protein
MLSSISLPMFLKTPLTYLQNLTINSINSSDFLKPQIFIFVIMKKAYTIYQVDAFTKTLFKGNPAGVVPDADGLTAEQMQQIARELNNSETAFLLPPESNDHEVWIRFFTPTVEVPSCGHATIASHYVRAIEKNLPSKTVHHKIGIGILPMDVIKEETDYKIMMTQGKPEFKTIIENDTKDELLKALGLDFTDLIENVPVQIVDTGHSKVVVGIKSKEKLNSLKPDNSILLKISKQVCSNGYHIFTLGSDEPDILTHCRMFAPAIGINEDPVTGNGNGPLGAYLVKYNLVKHNGVHLSFKSKQGEAINREGICHVEVFIENGEPRKVKIGGYAVVAFKTEIKI